MLKKPEDKPRSEVSSYKLISPLPEWYPSYLKNYSLKEIVTAGWRRSADSAVWISASFNN